jgi:uncharacterized membrane protein YraQ (UPF0718 family)
LKFIFNKYKDKSKEMTSMGILIICFNSRCIYVFSTLTEVPILQGLLAASMGKGPPLALLLASPSLSLPNMVVIRGIIGTEKTVVYVLLVVVMATLSDMVRYSS